MEINRTSIAAFQLFRIAGFAPYSLKCHRIYNDEIIAIKLSRIWCLYSISMLIVLGLLSNLGLHFDAVFPYPIRHVLSERRKSFSPKLDGLRWNGSYYCGDSF